MVILIIMLITGCSSNPEEPDNGKNSNTQNHNKNFSVTKKESDNNLSFIIKSGFEVDDKQSFWINLESYGQVKFVSGWNFNDPIRILKFYLIDKEENIIYRFSDLLDQTPWDFYGIRAISFKDANADGLKDIIIIAEYLTGAGPTGATPFPVAGIYFQNKKDFARVPELEEEINNSGKNESIELILDFIKSYNAKENQKNNLNKPLNSPDLTQQELLGLLNLKKEAILSKLGDQYSVIPTGAEGSYDGYYYKNHGITIVFENTDEIAFIECDKKVVISGAHAGMKFSQIKEKLGEAPVVESWYGTPENKVYEIKYKRENYTLNFFSFSSDGNKSELTIVNNYGGNR